MSRESIKKFPQSEIPQDDGRVLESGFRTSLQIGEQPKKRKTNVKTLLDLKNPKFRLYLETKNRTDELAEKERQEELERKHDRWLYKRLENLKETPFFSGGSWLAGMVYFETLIEMFSRRLFTDEALSDKKIFLRMLVFAVTEVSAIVSQKVYDKIKERKVQASETTSGESTSY
ncbi:hypothetical protein A2814_01630 [Candidatus Nomurabacteria bacterium RIFCSPHIGHO2_01_FULL_38_19]|uniref:Uncharacterized protein n=1 Tax=Candidatus Nomurabacteria bacterium RIFCSPHIGHO2_01_FULL_38_19 TaxID=1801732 RepID=A0A1F6UV30_9BACT|nr:MAG: hypothetical protein A2814_01630 [Candidatus Nomurabacteria bacterium RIFCSPHIGHO2_01_FULL_38_19]